MSYDKIRHYIGGNLCDHIGSLNFEQLTKQKKELLEDINLIKLPNDILFKRTVELEYINYLLT